VCVLLYFKTQYWGIVTVPGFPQRAKGARTHVSFSESPAYLLTLSSLRQSGGGRCLSFILTSLTIPIPSSFSSSRPATHTVDKHRQSPGNSMSRQVQKSFGLIGEGPEKWQDFLVTGIPLCAKSFTSHDPTMCKIRGSCSWR